MAIWGCNFNINFDQTLALGSSLCNTLRTKLHACTESSIIVEFMVKFIWQHNIPVGSYHTFKNAAWKSGFLVLKGQKMRHPPPPPCNSKTKSHRSELKWLLKYLITPNFCAKFQPNRLTTTFGPWNTFSDNDTSKSIRTISNFTDLTQFHLIWPTLSEISLSKFRNRKRQFLCCVYLLLKSGS